MTRLPFLFFVFLAVSAFAQEPPLTIDRAVDLAVQRNERAAVADTTVEAAEARVARGRSLFLPQVNVAGAYRNDSVADTRNTLGTTAFLTQPLFDARAFPLFRAIRLERDATRLSADEDKRLLAFDASTLFLTALVAERVLLAAEQRRQFAQTSLDDARARFEAGLVSSNDVTRAELELATAVRNVATTTGVVQTTRIDLATLLNTDVPEALAPPQELLTAAAQPPALTPAIVTEAQSRRNDITAARLRVRSAEEFAEEPGRRFIPTVLLTAQTRNINDGAISDRINDGFVSVAFNWPVLDAGVRRAETAERTAIARGAELDYKLALRTVEQQIRAAGVQLTSEQAASREAVAALRAARKNADETNELYRQGLASALELADANQRLFEAEVAEVTARFRMAQAYLALREARGVAPLGGE